MSRRNKLQKFASIYSFPNVYENLDPRTPTLVGENGQEVDMNGHWCERHFKNTNPLTLELACGRGEYTVGLAERFQERNFIGIDIKGARIWQGAKVALENGLPNAAFLRIRIEMLGHFFAEKEVDEIWITFPDPFLPNSKANRRLTSQPFLDRYRGILKKGGLVHLKTDERSLYDFTLLALSKQNNYTLEYSDDDIYSKPLPLPELDLKTYYERQHLADGKTIKYLRFKLAE